MIYDKRNRDNINKLADNTKKVTLVWYEFCVKNKIEILVYETIRTKTKQREYVNSGASQTMSSYHLVGQALDFVPVNSKGQTLWNGYETTKIQQAINKAKQLGFVWGGDWKSFVDKPHLQYEHFGYGSDTFGQAVVGVSDSIGSLGIDELVRRVRRGDYGNGDIRKKKLGSRYHEVQSIINGESYIVDLEDLATRTIRGEFGNGNERKKKLGSHYNDVQRIVNRRLK